MYSTSISFTIDSIPPISPGLSLPLNGSVLTDASYHFEWDLVGDIILYQIIINGSTNINTTMGTNYYIATALTNGSYTWQVRGQDEAGNWGNWSEKWFFQIRDNPTAPSGTNDNSETNGKQFWSDFFQNGIIIPLFGAIIAGAVGLIFWRYKRNH